MRTKLTTKQVRIPYTVVNAELQKAKFDDLDNLLDAIKTTIYTAAGAISPSDGLAIIDAGSNVLMAMTLVDGTVTGEKISIACRSGSAKIIPAHLTSGTELDLATGERVTLIWRGSAWAHSGHAASEGEFTIAAHGLSSGAGPYYIKSTVSLPGGVVAYTKYWMHVTDADHVQPCTSQANAIAGTAVQLTSAGAGTITLARIVPVVASDGDVSTDDELTITGHGIADEAAVEVRIDTAGVLPAPLAPATTYYTIVTDVDHLQLAASALDATANTQIDLTTDGTLPFNVIELAFKTVSAVDFAS